MPNQDDATSKPNGRQGETAGDAADVGRDDPHKVEKLARAGEDTGAAEHEE